MIQWFYGDFYDFVSHEHMIYYCSMLKTLNCWNLSHGNDVSYTHEF